MGASFLAVVLIMALLIIFGLAILHSLAVTAGVRIRADMVRLLQAYDNIIEAKSREVGGLQEQAEKYRKQTESSAAKEPVETIPSDGKHALRPSVPFSAVYRPKTFRGGYRTIRDSFRLNRQERAVIVEEVDRLQESGHRTEGRGEAAARLKNALSFDTVFRLSQLSPNEQLEILDTALEDRDWVLLRDFCEERRGGDFDITGFYNWLEERIALESNELSIRCGDSLISDLEEADCRPEICEGLQIVLGNLLYDYSIRESELS